MSQCVAALGKRLHAVAQHIQQALRAGAHDRRVNGGTGVLRTAHQSHTWQTASKTGCASGTACTLTAASSSTCSCRSMYALHL